jgi:PAS domain S-box-containing protein
VYEQYIKAIESTNIISKTDINGTITFVNDEFCAISGYQKDELIGKNHNIIRHPDVAKESFTKLWQNILAKKIYKTTTKNLTKDGETFYVNTTIIPILDTKGDIAEFVALRYDVTREFMLQERLEELNKTLEKRVKEQTKELRELNKNLEARVAKEVEENEKKQVVMFWQARHASLGQMLANIAHQWRQPLMELSLSLFNLKKSFLKDEHKEAERFYEQSKANIKSMSQTIEDFSNFFKPDKTKSFFNVKDAINDALSFFQHEDIIIKTELVDMEVLGSKNELTQVVLNILNNAKDAFLSRGVLVKEIVINTAKSKEFAHVEVVDNAGGIAKEQMQNMFEPYFSTKHKSRGTGLGLFMSKMICEKGLGGTIDIDSSGINTTLSIKIPLGRL